MTRKSILITGCSSGIGYDAALTLEKRGWRVFATCRKEADCERLREEDLESMRLDYADSKSIKSALAEILDRTGGTLDAVFNNGAFATPGFAEDLSRDALRDSFETNFFGPMELTNLVIPVMRRQGHGRIVQCSSVLGMVAMRGRGAYNSTKFAMEGFTDTMRLELIDESIEVILIEPGPIRTKIRENAQGKFEQWIDWKNAHNKEVYEDVLMPRLYAVDPPPDPGELQPDAVTKKLIHALEAKKPRPRYFVTNPTHLSAALRRILPTRALDKIVSNW